MNVYKLLSEKIYTQDLLELLLPESTYFTLTSHLPLSKQNPNELSTGITLMAELADYRIKSWYRYRTLNTPMSVSIFNTNKASIDLLEKYFPYLFEAVDNFISDMCFFKDKNLLLGTVSQEYIGELYLKNNSPFAPYKHLAKWGKIPFNSEEYLKLSIEMLI